MYLKIENLKKIFEKNRGIENINFEVEKGELISFLGPSGCGKTTLLNIIGGFLKPDNGKIYLEDIDITDFSPEKRDISTVFQSYALFPHMNVIENIKYGLKYRGLSKKDQENLAKEYLEIVGLKGYEKNSVQELSGGQQQRVAVARALAHNPKIIIADEPTGNLDDFNADVVWNLLKGANEQLGITVVVVTHRVPKNLGINFRQLSIEDGIIYEVS